MRWAPSQRIVDVGLPLGLFALGALDVARSSNAEDYPSPHWAHLVLLAAACALLLFRRRWPLAVFVATGAVTAIWIWTLYDPVRQQGPLEGFLAGLLAFYALGAYASRRAVLAALPFVALGIASDLVALALGRPTGNSLPSWIFYAAVFAFGRVLRSRLRLVRALAERAAELEVEREEKAAGA